MTAIILSDPSSTETLISGLNLWDLQLQNYSNPTNSSSPVPLNPEFLPSDPILWCPACSHISLSTRFEEAGLIEAFENWICRFCTLEELNENFLEATEHWVDRSPVFSRLTCRYCESRRGKVTIELLTQKNTAEKAFNAVSYSQNSPRKTVEAATKERDAIKRCNLELEGLE
jgi:hypothetical protein